MTSMPSVSLSSFSVYYFIFFFPLFVLCLSFRCLSHLGTELYALSTPSSHALFFSLEDYVPDVSSLSVSLRFSLFIFISFFHQFISFFFFSFLKTAATNSSSRWPLKPENKPSKQCLFIFSRVLFSVKENKPTGNSLRA